MEENWLTALFNNYLAGPANAILGLVGMKAADPAHPWETWLVMEILVVALLVALGLLVRSNLSVDRPGRLQHIFESLMEFLETQAHDVGIHHPRKYVNFFGTLFIFILCMNLIGIIPGFESPTGSYYVPVALAICTWVYYHVMGVRELGPLKYLAHFGGAILWMAPVMFIIEIIGHVARLLSLTVRLYANMFAGEQVTNVFIKLTYVGLPVIFMGLHVFVAFLQAYIFTLLTMIYVSMGTSQEH
ncbi:MAG TPA: F0F1 ATP synthase subunit A [Bryobacteraceae bacterium]|jgi:F-type H+-transporting ATPase subunit a